MTFVTKPRVHHPQLKVNDLGLTRRDYEGSVSTLCAGCGHDSVSAAIVQACAELSIPPHRFTKISGIGCSSKTPTYFLGKSHGFNSVHGRMPSVATGANLANKDLYCIGISGDGDTASIGMGQFAHIVRRRINMCYIVDNNGTYGLTKGQFSATNDKGSTSKKGAPNLYEPIDLVSIALQLGATFVARSFSGDKGQLVPLVKAGLLHKGFAFIDVISPCVAFNNHKGSDEELRLRARPPRRRHRGRVRAAARRNRRRLCAGHARRRGDARRFDVASAQARGTTTIRTIASRRFRTCSANSTKAKWSPACCISIRTHRTATRFSKRSIRR